MESGTSNTPTESNSADADQDNPEPNDGRSNQLDQLSRNDSLTREQKKIYKNKYFIAFMIFIVPIVIAVKIQVLFPNIWEVFEEDDGPYGPVSAHVMKIFEQYDENRDMKLNPFEFQTVFFAIKANNIDRVRLSDQETENVSYPLFSCILEEFDGS